MPPGPEDDFPCTSSDPLEHSLASPDKSSLTATAYRVFAFIFVWQQIFGYIIRRVWPLKPAGKQVLHEGQADQRNKEAASDGAGQQQKTIMDGVDVEMQQTNGSRLRFSMNDES